jgi:flagellar basal body-associated protein FliL
MRRDEPEEAPEKDVKRFIPLVVLGAIGLVAVAVLIALFSV